MEPKIHIVEQNTEKWHTMRLGIPTASQFHNIITPGGSRSTGEKRKIYMCKLICERIFRQPMQEDLTQIKAVQWGKQWEGQAAGTLASEMGLEIRRGEFYTRFNCGASPDYVILNGGNLAGFGAIEVKCPYYPWNHMSNMMYGPKDEYYPQVMGQMLICGFDYIRLISYHPAMPWEHKLYARDEKYLKRLQEELKIFTDELDAETDRAMAKGSFDAAKLGHNKYGA